jgi:RNA polymerase sigma factor (sigma-70 family)
MDDNILPLIEGCLSNDRASWNVLFQTCVSVTTNIHKRRYSSLTPDDTDNILSNISIKLFAGGLKNFKGKTKYEFLGYLKTITRNETVSYFREISKRKRNTSLDQDHENEDGKEDSSVHDFLEDNCLSPETICEINDLFKKAMDQLSIRNGQLLLYKVQGYKDKEIAELLDMPMNTVASSYSRIKDLLLRTLLIILVIILFGRNLPWKTSL